MKATVLVFSIIILLIVGMTWLFVHQDHECLKQDLRDVQMLHPDWASEQVATEARLLHKSHIRHR